MMYVIASRKKKDGEIHFQITSSFFLFHSTFRKKKPEIGKMISTLPDFKS